MVGDTVKRLKHFMHARAFLVALVVGSLAIICWTLFRFFSDATIFDLVGQQVYAQELLRTGFGDAQLGATHYLLKVFFIYIPFHLSGLSPRAALITMTILVDTVSYVLICFGLRRIAAQLGIKVGKFFYIGIVWLGVFAGSYFWINFTNSRNLELAAGVWVIAVALSFLQQPHRKKLIGLLLLMTLTFYMDVLQLFMAAVPVVVYAAIVYRRHVARVLLLAAMSGVATLLAGVLLVLTTTLLQASFADSGGFASPHDLGLLVKDLATANTRFFLGVVADGGRLRQVVALVGVATIVIAWVVLLVRRTLSGKVAVFVACFIIIVELVYCASGQVVNGDTSRYLILLAPIIVIVIASLEVLKKQWRRVVMIVLAGVVIVNGLFAVCLMAFAWPQRFSGDQHLSTLSAYVAPLQTVRFYGSMDNAFAVDYYYPNSVVLPLACQQGVLSRAKSFFPNGAFGYYQAQTTTAAILVTNDAITNFPNVCTTEDIVKQLGTPRYTVALPDNQEALYYGDLHF